MNRHFCLVPVLLFGTLAAGGSLDGSWKGMLNAPNHPLRIVFNIKTAGGKLTGTMDSPDQKASGIPVEGTAAGDTVQIQVKSVIGVYNGKLSANGGELHGVWKQGPTLPLTITRPNGSASSPEGVWQGQLKTPTQGTLRVVFNIKKAGGKFTGTMDSPDQHAKGLPIEEVVLSGGTLHIGIRLGAEAGNGVYTGQLSKDGKSATGDWWQGVSLPLTLKRSK